MKKNLFKIFLLLLLFPAKLFAQDNQDITGLWKGTIYNDTTKKTLHYELAISKEKGELIGYSYTEFDFDGKIGIGVKKIKIKMDNGKVLISDVELIDNSYPVNPPKNIHQYSVLTLKNTDTIRTLSGNWNTNLTKQFRPVTGTLTVQRKSDYVPTYITEKLDEVRVINQIRFDEVHNKIQGQIVVQSGPSQKSEDSVKAKHQEQVLADQKAKDDLAKAKAEQAAADQKAKDDLAKAKQDQKTADQKATVAAAAAIEKEKAAPAAETPPAADIATRKMDNDNIQKVYYHSDSLVLSLYDNGIVDGDVVSVVLNGQVLFSKQMLTTKANSKTIYINQGIPDSAMLILYAENLGSIPPNTGLLTVRDGESVYEEFFSADLKTNAGIMLIRKKPDQPVSQ
ncbi:MAG TPA: hypothetical protein VK718_01215 [Ferruginibacter sp.]|jgi:hypothetical protein|nr:hypothetical protein [Ferruginibacter sp.]